MIIRVTFVYLLYSGFAVLLDCCSTDSVPRMRTYGSPGSFFSFSFSWAENDISLLCVSFDVLLLFFFFFSFFVSFLFVENTALLYDLLCPFPCV